MSMSPEPQVFQVTKVIPGVAKSGTLSRPCTHYQVSPWSLLIWLRSTPSAVLISSKRHTNFSWSCSATKICFSEPPCSTPCHFRSGCRLDRTSALYLLLSPPTVELWRDRDASSLVLHSLCLEGVDNAPHVLPCPLSSPKTEPN